MDATALWRSPAELLAGSNSTDAYAYAVAVMSQSATTHDAQEGIAAFLGKRRPTYTDRP